MSILDDNYIKRTDKLFLLGRWLPLTPQISKLWTLHYEPRNGSTFGNPVEVDEEYAKRLCNTMFDGKLTLCELWELIGRIEVSPDWVNNWNKVAGQTEQKDMERYNELINGELVQKIANELIKLFAENGMHIMSLNEFDMMHMWPPTCKDDDWFCYEPGILLHANWFESPAYIKIMMTSNGIGFGLLYACAKSTSWDICDINDPKNNPFIGPYGNYWEHDLFVLDLSPEKSRLGKPRDIDGFMIYQQYQQASQGAQIRYNYFNQ